MEPLTTSGMELTPKQQLFVQEYLVDLNATRAAIRAGYSAASAHNQGYRMMMNDEVGKAIQKAMDERSERTRVAVDRVIDELSLIAFANIHDYLCLREGKPTVNLAKLTREQAAAIREVKVEGYIGGGTHLKMNDKLAALIALGRHLERAMARDERSRAALTEEMNAALGQEEQVAIETPLRTADRPVPEAAAAKGAGSVAQAPPKPAGGGVAEVVPPIGEEERGSSDARLPVAESSAPDAATAACAGSIGEPSSMESEAAAAEPPPAAPARPRRISAEEAERRFEAALRARSAGPDAPASEPSVEFLGKELPSAGLSSSSRPGVAAEAGYV